MELVYTLIDLADGSVRAWSSRTGERIELGRVDWREVMAHPAMRAELRPAKVMIHFLGDAGAVPDWARMRLMEEAKASGYGLVRFEEGDPPLDPEEAYGLLLTPFT
ncbi:MAG: hypothetical protein HQK87_07405 [Nitrospinae bacterium]|nr:hypothetical protein [Nitrospinota bacterium]